MALPEPDEDAIELFERLEEAGPPRAAIVRLRLSLAEQWPPAHVPSSREGVEFAQQCEMDPVEAARSCAALEGYLARYLDAVARVVCEAGREVGAGLQSSNEDPSLDAVRIDAAAAPGAATLDWSDDAVIVAPRATQAVALDLLGVEPDGSIAGIVESVRRTRDRQPTDHDAVLLRWAQASQLRALRPDQASNAPTDPRLVQFRLRVAWAAGGEVRARALSADHPSLLHGARRLVERHPDREQARAAFTTLAEQAGHPSGFEAQARGPETRPRRFTTLHAVLLVILVVLFFATYVLQK